MLATSDSGATFQVVVSNGVNPSATSTPATLTVNPASVAPSITTQPANATAIVGATATFNVVATGTAPLSYQWQKNNSAIVNAPNSSSYTTPVLATGDSGSTFRVVVSNGVNPPATSNSATLTVNSARVAPSITTQPSDVTVAAGATATFGVVAAGTAPLSYQWERNNSAIPNAPNSASYTTPVLTTADNGATFQVIVNNSVSPPATSSSATLTVNPATPPPPSTASVLTYHNDSGRTGLNPNETILNTTNVNSATFGKLGTVAVTGLVDAQPLYVPGLMINGAIHNVVYVVTEHDMVYAFDADTPGAALWQISAIPSTEALVTIVAADK